MPAVAAAATLLPRCHAITPYNTGLADHANGCRNGIYAGCYGVVGEATRGAARDATLSAITYCIRHSNSYATPIFADAADADIAAACRHAFRR